MANQAHVESKHFKQKQFNIMSKNLTHLFLKVIWLRDAQGYHFDEPLDQLKCNSWRFP